MSQRTLQELVEEQRAHVVSYFKENPEDTIKPTFLAQTGTGDRRLYFVDWGNEDEKKVMLSFLKETFLKNNIVSYSFVTEIWMSKSATVTRQQPSQSNDREEAIMILAATATESKVMILRMIRDETGAVLELREDPNIENAGFQGRTLDLLKPDNNDSFDAAIFPTPAGPKPLLH